MGLACGTVACVVFVLAVLPTVIGIAACACEEPVALGVGLQMSQMTMLQLAMTATVH